MWRDVKLVKSEFKSYYQHNIFPKKSRFCSQGEKSVYCSNLFLCCNCNFVLWMSIFNERLSYKHQSDFDSERTQWLFRVIHSDSFELIHYMNWFMSRLWMGRFCSKGDAPSPVGVVEVSAVRHDAERILNPFHQFPPETRERIHTLHRTGSWNTHITRINQDNPWFIHLSLNNLSATITTTGIQYEAVTCII